MNWRGMAGSKLMTPSEAGAVVKPGDQVMVGIINCTPSTLGEALYAGRGELEGVRIDHAAPLFPGVRDGSGAAVDTVQHTVMLHHRLGAAIRDAEAAVRAAHEEQGQRERERERRPWWKVWQR